MGKGDGNTNCGARPATDEFALTGGGTAVAERPVSSGITRADMIVHTMSGGNRPLLGRQRRDRSRIADGDDLYHALLDEIPTLTQQQMRELAKIAQEHEDERERKAASDYLTMANQKWVRQAAAQSPYRKMGAHIDDLAQAGTLGLMDSIKRFDAKRGTKFMTPAAHKVRQAMQRNVGEADVAVAMYGARIAPDVFSTHMPAVKRAMDALDRERALPGDDATTFDALTGDAPAVRPRATAEEIIERTVRDSERAVEEAAKKGGRRRIPITREQAEWAFHCLTARPTSLQTQLRSDEGDGVEFGDMIVDEQQTLEDQAVADAEAGRLRDIIVDCVDHLPAKHQLVAKHLFEIDGIDGWEPLEPKEIADRYSMSLSQIGKLHSQALEQMASRLTEVHGITSAADLFTSAQTA